MKTVTLKKNFEFKRVYKYGRSIVNRYIVVYYMKNKKNYNRIGITVSKKVGNSVTRNRVRRLIKESLLQIEENLVNGYDIVIIARVMSNGVSYDTIKKSVSKTFSILFKK